MDRLQRVRLAAGGEVAVLPTIHGLVSERDVVRAAVVRVQPAFLAIALSPEATANLLRYEPDPEVDPMEEIADIDAAYSVRLAEFGQVDLPPPDLMEAVRQSKERGVPLFGVDLPEESYEEAWTREVSVWGFLRYGRIQRRLTKRPPRAKDAEAFTLEWDRRIRKVKGIARVEALREEAIARNVEALAAKGEGPVLVVVDVPRAAGVLARLRAPAP